MNDYTFTINDSYPNIQGRIAYNGPIDTVNMTAALMVNGIDDGSEPFSGDVLRIGGDSEDADSSTFYWSFAVDASMTAVEGSYKLYIRITHTASSEIETRDAGLTVTVEDIT